MTYLSKLAEPTKRNIFKIGFSSKRFPMSGDQRYNIFKGRKRNDPNFGELNEEAYDPADVALFDKLKTDVKASGAHISLDK